MAVRTWPTALFVKMSRALTLLLVGAATVGVAQAAASSSPAPEEKVTLHIGMVQEPDNLNPFIGIQGTDYMLWHMNYDFLVGFDAETLEPRPELATEWDVSEDGLVWTFTIRDDATWHDGEPVTASDVAFTFNYINENELLNLAAYTDGITKAEAVDDTHVLITTSQPKANILKMVVPILPEHIWSKVDGKAVPQYFVMVGGGIDANGTTFGRLAAKVPASAALSMGLSVPSETCMYARP